MNSDNEGNLEQFAIEQAESYVHGQITAIQTVTQSGQILTGLFAIGALAALGFATATIDIDVALTIGGAIAGGMLAVAAYTCLESTQHLKFEIPIWWHENLIKTDVEQPISAERTVEVRAQQIRLCKECSAILEGKSKKLRLGLRFAIYSTSAGVVAWALTPHFL